MGEFSVLSVGYLRALSSRSLLESCESHALYDAITATYDVRSEDLSLAGTRCEILAVRDSNLLVDSITPETFAVDERLPYWADLWTSSVAIAEHILCGPPLKGLTVLELGCGLGLCGIAAAMAGGNVTLTDYEFDALLFARWNALRNLPPGVVRERVRVEQLDWRAPVSNRTSDLIIGGDIAYDRSVFDSLLHLLDSALARDGVALFGDPDRTVGRNFLLAAEQFGFRVSRSIRPVHRHDRVSPIVLAEIRRLEGA